MTAVHSGYGNTSRHLPPWRGEEIRFERTSTAIFRDACLRGVVDVNAHFRCFCDGLPDSKFGNLFLLEADIKRK